MGITDRLLSVVRSITCIGQFLGRQAISTSKAPTASLKQACYFNIPFRQLCDIAAAYCHIRAAVDYVKYQPKKKDLDQVNHVLHVSVLLGVVFAVLLWWYR